MSKEKQDKSAGNILPEGTLINRYAIRRLIGRGGMGEVYVALDPLLNRKIAVKILHFDKIADAAHVAEKERHKQRLLREAQAMAAIGHPNIVQVHDVGTYKGNVFIAMEFVSGRTLREWNAEVTPKDWEEILKVYLSAAEALHAAHECQLIHRDFKPDNVMLGFDGRVRVMDFGLARTFGVLPADSSLNTSDVLELQLTATGMIMGTPVYMAPEQFLGEPVDARSDQFAFCVALYEALYGFRPFQGQNMTEVAKAILRGKIQLPPKDTPVPDFVFDALLKGLQCTPEERWESMLALKKALKGSNSTKFYHPWVLYVIVGIVGVSGLAFYLWSARQWSKYQSVKESNLHALLEKAEKAEKAEKENPIRTGAFSEEDVEQVLQRNWGDVDTCYRRGLLRKPDLRGEIVFKVSVDQEGLVEEVALEMDSMTDKKFSGCLMGLIMTWDFPPPEGGSASVLLALDLDPGQFRPPG